MNVKTELPGFMGSREQVVLSAYLEALSVEQRDRVIGAPSLEAGGGDKGPCLVMVAECMEDFCGPIAMAISNGPLQRHPAFRFDAMHGRHGAPFIRWLKIECSRLNGSSPQDIANLSTPVAAVVVPCPA